MEIFLGWFIFALLVGLLAGSRGRGSGNWFVLAMLISPLLAVIALALLPNLKGQPSPDSHVKCPDCRELVLIDARKCKHCGAALTPQAAATPGATQATNLAQVWQRNKALLITIAIIAGLAIVSSTR